MWDGRCIELIREGGFEPVCVIGKGRMRVWFIREWYNTVHTRVNRSSNFVRVSIFQPVLSHI